MLVILRQAILKPNSTYDKVRVSSNYCVKIELDSSVGIFLRHILTDVL